MDHILAAKFWEIGCGDFTCRLRRHVTRFSAYDDPKCAARRWFDIHQEPSCNNGTGATMTILFSVATQRLITMTVDSAVTNEFSDHREYNVARKYFHYEGVGCVATWGERVGNNIRRYLDAQNISAERHTVEDLARLVREYLTNEYRAHDPASGDIGYHVAGFDRETRPRLYHVFWGFPRPNPENLPQDYYSIDHSPTTEEPIQFLYNGRNDIAHPFMQLLIQEVRSGRDMGFRVDTPLGLARFGDFIARFAGELTPEVGPSFDTTLISNHNGIELVKNTEFRPLEPEQFIGSLTRLNIQYDESLVTGIAFTGEPSALMAAPSGTRLVSSAGTVTAIPY